MTLWQFTACVRGFYDRQEDAFGDNVLTGYYAAYYNNTKHAKSPAAIIKNVQAATEKQFSKAVQNDVDMDAEILKFQHREHQRLNYWPQQKEKR